MLDSQVIGGTTGVDDLPDDILGVLDRRRVQVILGIEVEVDAVISKRLHVGPTAGFLTALRVRGPHVRRILSNNVGDRSLVLHHLILADSRRDVREAVVGPSV